MLSGWITSVVRIRILKTMNKFFFGVEKIDKISGTAFALGYAGALPFIFLVILQWQGYEPMQNGLNLIYFYGCIILSFLGAPHWGYILAIADKGKTKNLAGRLVIGVIPSLIAFFSITVSEIDRLLIIGSSFIFVYVIDSILFRQQIVPNWFLPLRLRLTLIVVMSFLFSIILIIFRE